MRAELGRGGVPAGRGEGWGSGGPAVSGVIGGGDRIATGDIGPVSLLPERSLSRLCRRRQVRGWLTRFRSLRPSAQRDAAPVRPSRSWDDERTAGGWPCSGKSSA